MKKRFLSILTALALCLSLLPAPALAVYGDEAARSAPAEVEPTIDETAKAIYLNGLTGLFTSDGAWWFDDVGVEQSFEINGDIKDYTVYGGAQTGEVASAHVILENIDRDGAGMPAAVYGSGGAGSAVSGEVVIDVRDRANLFLQGSGVLSGGTVGKLTVNMDYDYQVGDQAISETFDFPILPAGADVVTVLNYDVSPLLDREHLILNQNSGQNIKSSFTLTCAQPTNTVFYHRVTPFTFIYPDGLKSADGSATVDGVSYNTSWLKNPFDWTFSGDALEFYANGEPIIVHEGYKVYWDKGTSGPLAEGQIGEGDVLFDLSPVDPEGGTVAYYGGSSDENTKVERTHVTVIDPPNADISYYTTGKYSDSDSDTVTGTSTLWVKWDKFWDVQNTPQGTWGSLLSNDPTNLVLGKHESAWKITLQDRTVHGVTDVTIWQPVLAAVGQDRVLTFDIAQDGALPQVVVKPKTNFGVLLSAECEDLDPDDSQCKLVTTFLPGHTQLTPESDSSTVTYGENNNSLTINPPTQNITYTSVDNEDVLEHSYDSYYTIKGAGTATVYFIYLPNGNDNAPVATYGEATHTVFVEPKTVELDWSGTDFTYNGRAQRPTATVSNLVGDDRVSVTVTGAAVNAGTYTATASALTGEDSGNYDLPRENTIQFTIKQATPTVENVQFTDTIYVYQGKPMLPVPLTAETSAPGTLALDPDQTLNAGENVECTWTFTPEDTVNYETVTGTVTFSKVVEDTPKSLVVTGPDKLDYVEGQSFDTTGLSVRALLNGSGEEVDVTEAATISVPDPLAAGPAECVITFGGLSHTIRFTVQPKPITPEKVTVTFDSNGGSYVPSQTVKEGDTVDWPGEPYRSGYDFRGWYLDRDRYDFNTPVMEDMTLTARWREIEVEWPDWDDDDDQGKDQDDDKEVIKNPDGSETTITEDKDGTVTEKTEYPDGSEVTVETKPDGTVTTTEKDPEGNKTEIVEKPDGSSVTTVEKIDGTVTITVVDPDGKVLAQVVLTEKAMEGKETVEIPMPALPASNDRETAPTVTLAVPEGVSVKVEVPVENPTPGTVAIIVHEDGREKIIKSSIATDNGVALTIQGSTTVKIVDNSKDFQDVAPTSWAADSVDFVTARELFGGVSETDFAPNTAMTWQMLMTVLARLDGVDTTADPYGLGMTWAVGQGISDGSDPTGTITREQLAVMLYRYAQSEGQGFQGAWMFQLDYADAGQVSQYAYEAMCWATMNGIITGTTDTTLDPKGEATRAQVAAMIQRYCENNT